MSRFDGNPFEEDSSRNPFAGGGGGQGRTGRVGGASGSFLDSVPSDRVPMAPGSALNTGYEDALPSLRMKPLPPESRAGSAFDATADIPLTPRGLKRKQKELQSKEAELRRKERELASREENLGVSKANWPPFFPLIRHDIRADIPEFLQATQRVAFYSWLGAMFALTYNFTAVVVGWCTGALSFTFGMVAFFTALIFLMLGVPLSYLFWYRRLYISLKNDSSIGLVLFFISYSSHILWFLLFAIAPPIYFGGCYMTGILSTIGLFASGSWVVGILYAIGTVLFSLEILLSVYVLGQVFAYWRGTGKANQLKQEAAMAALRNAV